MEESANSPQTFPDAGELFKTYLDDAKKSDHLIFFVHFYKGHKKALRRHIEFVNQIGYDAYVFNLKDSAKEHQYLPYSPISKKFGMKHALADQIEEHLNLLSELLPQYKTKIVFAFSNVAGAAIEAIARRQPQDILALICDSGPGADLMHSSYNLLEEQLQVRFLPLKLISTPLVMLGWSKDLHKDISHDLQKFPNGFPILSIRGWKDKQISPSHIDQIFEPAKNVNWRKLSLPEAGHLNGLRDFPSDYRSGVEDFLRGLS